MEQDFDFDLQVKDQALMGAKAGDAQPMFATTWICGTVVASALTNCTGQCPSANTRCTTIDTLC